MRAERWMLMAALVVLAACRDQCSCRDAILGRQVPEPLEYEIAGPCAYRYAETPPRAGLIAVEIDGIAPPYTAYTVDLGRRILTIKDCPPDGGPGGKVDIFYVYDDWGPPPRGRYER